MSRWLIFVLHLRLEVTKSSIVQAGLIPRLRRERPPASTWDAAIFTPGKDPFRRLASALIPFLEPEENDVERLAKAEDLSTKLIADRVPLEAVLDLVVQSVVPKQPRFWSSKERL